MMSSAFNCFGFLVCLWLLLHLLPLLLAFPGLLILLVLGVVLFGLRLVKNP